MYVDVLFQVDPSSLLFMVTFSLNKIRVTISLNNDNSFLFNLTFKYLLIKII